MAIELPGYVVDVFYFLDLPWPNVDEDELRGWASDLRRFGTEFTGHSGRARRVTEDLAASSSSDALHTIASAWQRWDGLFAALAPAMGIFADALDVAADEVVAQKLIVIEQAIQLVAELAATTVGAFFTFGADEAAAPLEILGTKEIVQGCLRVLENEIIGRVAGYAAGILSDDVSATLTRDLFGGLNLAGTGDVLRADYETITGASRQVQEVGDEADESSRSTWSSAESRQIETPGVGGGWPVTAVLKQLLERMAELVFSQLPRLFLGLLRDTWAYLSHVVAAFKETDEALARDAEREDSALQETAAGGLAIGASEHFTGDVETGGIGGGDGGGAPGEDEQGLEGDAGTAGGQPSEGNGSAPTAGDPVDIVSGQMLLTAVDLELPGVLSLILRRAYASSYRAGRLFGPGWSSTLDQRVQVDADGIRFAGDDAQILNYALPPQSSEPVLPVAGARWPLSWDRLTDTITIGDPGRGWTLEFDGTAVDGTAGVMAGGRDTRYLTRITDRNGNVIVISRDRYGLPTEVAHSGGYRVGITAAGPRVEGLRLLGPAVGQSAVGNQTRARNQADEPGTEIVRYGYDSFGRLVQVTNLSGAPYTYEYDRADRITAWVDRSGYRYQYDYDEDGRVVRGTGDGGYLSATFGYDTNRRVTTVTNSLGHASTYHHDEHGHLTMAVNPEGGAVTTEFDQYGRLLSHTDELGRRTRFVLDENGDPVRSIDPNGDPTDIRYSELGLIAAITSGGVTRAEYAYDERGNLLTETDACGAVTRYEYDDHGGMNSITDALGNTTAIERDPAGLILSVTDALGRTNRVTRDRFGRVVELTDAYGARSLLVRRPDGLVTARVTPDGSREEWEYDAGARVVGHRDQTGALTRFEPGPFGRLLARVQPDEARFDFAYDAEFRLTAVSAARGTTITSGDVSWTYEYDPAGRLVSESDFNGRTQRYSRDAAGQLLELTGTDGRSTVFTYDSTGELIERRDPSGAVTTFNYDATGFLITAASPQCTVEYTRDRAGRVLAETVDGRSLRYEYDPLGRCTRRVTPTGIVSEWTYDATDHPLTLATTAGHIAFTYDDLGREITRSMSGGVTLNQTWDVRHRLTGQAIWAAADTSGASGGMAAALVDRRSVSQRIYSYSPNDLLTAVTDSVAGHRAITVTPAGRVAEVSGEDWTEHYAYDLLGNITYAEFAHGAGGGARAEDRAYSGTLLRATSGRSGATGRSYDYDDRGRLTRKRSRTLSGKRQEWRYTWDDDDQLIQVVTPDQGTWTYQYDPFGRRIVKQRLGGAGAVTESVQFTWDETRVTEQVAVRADGSRHSVTWDWEPGTWRAATQTERQWSSASQTDFDQRFFSIVTDLAGGADQFVSVSGQVTRGATADIWGRPVSGGGVPGPSPLGKPGQYRDEETGLDYNYFRYYDPETGRYLTGDPLGLEPAPNQYAYVINPLAWIDPLGLGSQSGQSGGRYGLMKPANPKGFPNGSYEINHIPAQDSWLQLGLADSLSEHSGPAIRMDYNDHRDFISTGSSLESFEWRAEQARLIKQGEFDKAMQMDIEEIRRVHGMKYDAAIKEMVGDMPENKGFQRFLQKNGWKIRYCLLQ